MSNAAGAVVASTPVTNRQILLRPVMTGLPLEYQGFVVDAFERDPGKWNCCSCGLPSFAIIVSAIYSLERANACNAISANPGISLR
jgi:hypothetical protein